MSLFLGAKMGLLAPHPAEKSLRVGLGVLGTVLPDPAPEVDYTSHDKARPDFGNMQFSDCTAAMIANAVVGVLRAAYGKVWVPSTADALSFYENFGFDPSRKQPDGSNPTDNGAVMEDVIAFVRKNGFKGHHLVGSVAVDPKSVINVKRVVDWFGQACLGLNLPLAWQAMRDWTLQGYAGGDANWQAGSWGPHAVCVEKYDANGLWVWTWGKLVFVSWEAFLLYGMECEAPIWASWIRNGSAPSGLALDALEQRQKAMALH